MAGWCHKDVNTSLRKRIVATHVCKTCTQIEATHADTATNATQQRLDTKNAKRKTQNATLNSQHSPFPNNNKKGKKG